MICALLEQETADTKNLASTTQIRIAGNHDAELLGGLKFVKELVANFG